MFRGRSLAVFGSSPHTTESVAVRGYSGSIGEERGEYEHELITSIFDDFLEGASSTSELGPPWCSGEIELSAEDPEDLELTNP
jgi:hypothetical protein